jgi:type IX secretion system PorP/SprF family membrane protein
MKKIFLSLMVLLLQLYAVAQDPFFTQAFNSPLSLNPATAGTGEMDLRFTATFKRHFINVPSRMQYAVAGVDRYVKNFHGGVGLMLMNSKEGYINKNALYGIYSYGLCLQNARLHLGLQAGIANRNVDYDKLYFSDQIDNTGVIPGAVSGADRPLNNNKYFADFAAGFLLYYGSNWMIGGGAQHVNQPDESLTSNIYSKLPRKWFGYVRYKMDIDEDGFRYFLPSIIYYQQGKSNSVSVGCEYKDARVGIGAWYRGNVDFKNSDAFAVTISLDLFDHRTNDDRRARIGVSYDATTSKLGFSRSAGSGEGAFIYEKLTPKGVKSEDRCEEDYKMTSMPCPPRF